MTFQQRTGRREEICPAKFRGMNFLRGLVPCGLHILKDQKHTLTLRAFMLSHESACYSYSDPFWEPVLLAHIMMIIHSLDCSLRVSLQLWWRAVVTLVVMSGISFPGKMAHWGRRSRRQHRDGVHTGWKIYTFTSQSSKLSPSPNSLQSPI